MLPYTAPRRPASGIVLCSGDNAVNGNRYCSNNAPLSPILASGGPPVKIRPGSLYDCAALIAPEDGNTRSIWLPPWCGHQWSGFHPHRNRLATETYPQSILPDRKNYRDWKEIPEVRPSSPVDSGVPPGQGYRSAPEVERSAKVH